MQYLAPLCNSFFNSIDNRTKLLLLMVRHGLNNSQVADITGYSLSTVNKWTSKRGRLNISNESLSVIRCHIKLRKVSARLHNAKRAKR